MTPEQFFEACDMGGMGYELTRGMSKKLIESIIHEKLREAAIKASDALIEIEKIREELGIEQI